MRFFETNQKRCQWSHQNFEQRYHRINHHRCRCQPIRNRITPPNPLWIESTYYMIQNVPYVFVPSKKALGAACGTTRNVITVSILKNKMSKLNDDIQKIVGECERLFISSWSSYLFKWFDSILFFAIFLINQ